MTHKYYLCRKINVRVMKKFKSIFITVMLAAVPFTFVGCDEDYEIADTLWGVWEGNMYIYSQWNGHTYQSTYSVIQFDRAPNHYDSGTGYWVDYYSGAPWDYFASHIQWVVSNGRIQIYSYEDDSYYYIYDYSLSENHFSGIIESQYGDPMEFYLSKTAAPDWNDYEWGWDYSDDWDWRWTRNATYDNPTRIIGKTDNAGK